MKKNKNIIWRIVAKSLGEKNGNTDREADQVAMLRLMMFLSIFITNAFIIYNALRTHHFPNYEIKGNAHEFKTITCNR